jgi:hypothetical protein
VELTGDLVAGHVAPAVFLHGFERRRRVSGAGLDDGGHALAKALVGGAHHDGVHHVGVVADDGLDLLGEDLLAPRVDADGAPAEQGHRTVGLDGGEVTGHDEALAVDVMKTSAVFLGSL